MKKLGKKLNSEMETIAAYCSSPDCQRNCAGGVQGAFVGWYTGWSAA